MIAYITTQGAKISAHSRRLVAKAKGVQLGEIETVRCDGLMLFGAVEITTPAITLCSKSGIPVSFLTKTGSRLKARILPAGAHRRFRRQYRLLDDEDVCLRLSKEIIVRKLEYQLAVIEDYSGNLTPEPETVRSARRGISDSLNLLAEAVLKPEMMGIEGIAAHAYFGAWKSLLRFGDWQGREGRGASDPVNALLNLAYSLLTSELVARLDAAGLDPDAGFLHADRSGRPSLALDLLEPFRPLIADRFVLSLFNRREVDPAADFEMTDKGLRLADGTWREVLQKWEKRQDSPVPGGSQETADEALKTTVDKLVTEVVNYKYT